MKWLEYIRLALSEIWHNKTRTFLTLIGIIIGIASVIVIIFIVQGAESFLMQEIEKIAPTDVLLAYAQWGTNNRPLGNITMEDVQLIKEKESSRIRAIAPQYRFSEEIRHGILKQDTNIIAGSGEIYDVFALKMAQGRFLSKFDLDNLNQVIVLNKQAAEELFPGENPLAQKISLMGITFKVIGVLADSEESIIPMSVNDNNVYIPFTVWERLRGISNRFTLMVKLRDRAFMKEEVARIQQILDLKYGLTEKGQSKFTVRDWSSGLDQVQIVKIVLMILLSGVASITLLVAGIGLMNIMLVIITERTKEIGLRKALGATRKDIIIQFVMEAIVLSLLGGIIGVLVGYSGSELALNIANNYISFDFNVPFWAVIISLVFTTGVGIFFGIYPAYKAARLDPITALRYE